MEVHARCEYSCKGKEKASTILQVVVHIGIAQPPGGKKTKKYFHPPPYTALTLSYVCIIRGNAIKLFGKYLTSARWYTACIFIFVETRRSREKALSQTALGFTFVNVRGLRKPLLIGIFFFLDRLTISRRFF